MTLRLLDTFSGIGGFSYAAEQLVGGYETVAFVEREPYCQKILRKHWPDVPIHDDITTFNPAPGSADVVCGGFPCQDISTAGKQAGIKEGTRSGLFYELMRVIRLVGPQYVILENVAAITFNGLDTVLGTLAEAGFDAEWACIPAADVGACHRRDRWWLVAYAKNLLSNGRPARHGEQLGWRAVPESGDGGSTERIVTYSNNARPQAPRAEQFAAGTEQHRELDAANTTVHGPQGSGQRWTATHCLNPSWGGYISKPVLRRGDDGLSNRVDRLKALGNAVVPQVAAIPLARVRHLAGV